MGFLDSLFSGDQTAGATGSTPPAGGAIASAIGDLINQHGGLSGLAQQFGKQGLGDVFSSWVGHGENQTVDPDQVHQAVGTDKVNAFAEKLGINPAMAATLIAQFLPQVIDRLTASGKVEPQHDEPSTLQGLLQTGLGKIFG